MKFRDLLRLTFSNLNRMRGRAIMTALGVTVGTMAIVVLVALATGLRDSVTGDLSGFGPINQINVFPSAFAQSFESGAPPRRDDEGTLTPRALDDIARTEGVTAVTPQEGLIGSYQLKLNRLQASANVIGIDPRVVDEMLTVAEGSNRLSRGSVIVGGRLAEQFVDPRQRRPSDDEPIDLYGQTLLLEMTRQTADGESVSRTVRLRVVGVLETGTGQGEYDIYMSLDEVENLSAWTLGSRIDRERNGYTRAIVIVDDPEQILQIELDLNQQGYLAFSSRTALQQINLIFTIIQAVFGGIGAISLIVAAIGIANTMIMSILERTREIGLMKAVGATNRDVMSVFITEAGFIGMMGGIFGVILGWLASRIIDLIAVTFINAQVAAQGGTPEEAISIAVIPLWLPVFSILFALVIGLASGIYPALRAVGLNPVTALKYE